MGQGHVLGHFINDTWPAPAGPGRIIIIIITRFMTHVKVIHRVKNRKCGWSRISEGKLGCKVQSLPIVWKLQDRRGVRLCLVVNCSRLLVRRVKKHDRRRLDPYDRRVADSFRMTEVGVKQHETWCWQGSSAVVLSRPSANKWMNGWKHSYCFRTHGMDTNKNIS